jgi:hypothetical protein
LVVKELARQVMIIEEEAVAARKKDAEKAQAALRKEAEEAAK